MRPEPPIRTLVVSAGKAGEGVPNQSFCASSEAQNWVTTAPSGPVDSPAGCRALDVLAVGGPGESQELGGAAGA